MCNERNVTISCGNDMGCSCVVKEYIRYNINEQMMVRYALLKGNEDGIEGMKVYSDDVKIEGVVWSSEDNVYEVYFKNKKVDYINVVFEYIVVNGIRKEYRNNNKKDDNMYVNTLVWKTKHQNYFNINETLNLKLILNVNTTFNDTAIISSIQHNDISIITHNNNINIKTIIITYNPITLLPTDIIIYYIEFPFYFSSCSIQTLNIYVIIFTFLFLLCLIYIIHFILSSILIDKLS
jgi:hypothetical protein